MKTICFSLAVVTLMACHSRSEKEQQEGKVMYSDMIVQAADDAPAAQNYMTPPAIETDRKLIREARLQMDVASLKNISDSVSVLLRQYQAYASNEAQENQRYDLR